MAAKARLILYQGSTFKKVIKCEYGGAPVDLTGVSIVFKFGPAGGATFSYSTASGHITIDNPSTGTFTITIPADVTSSYVWATANFDIHFIFPTGEVNRPLQGTLRLSRSV